MPVGPEAVINPRPPLYAPSLLAKNFGAPDSAVWATLPLGSHTDPNDERQIPSPEGNILNNEPIPLRITPSSECLYLT